MAELAGFEPATSSSRMISLVSEPLDSKCSGWLELIKVNQMREVG